MCGEGESEQGREKVRGGAGCRNVGKEKNKTENKRVRDCMEHSDYSGENKGVKHSKE